MVPLGRPWQKQETPPEHSLFYELNSKLNQSKHTYFKLNSTNNIYHPDKHHIRLLISIDVMFVRMIDVMGWWF